MTVRITVAQVLLSPAFRAGRACIEYDMGVIGQGAYTIKQVAVVLDEKGSAMAIERHRNFKSELTDPMPPWRATRGSGCCRVGFYGLWLPHLSALWSPCRVVALKPAERFAERWKVGDQKPTMVPLGEKSPGATTTPPRSTTTRAC